MLSRLVAFDTTSSRSNLPLIEAVADYLHGYGIEPQFARNAAGDKANLFATIGPPGDGGIVLSGHSDCVPVEGQAWSTDPFETVTRDGRIYGRGTCDMKGFIAAALALVPEMIEARPKTPLHLVLSYDEELGCRGIPTLLERLGEDLPRPEIALVGEPTSMRPVNAHKGIYSFETVVTGREAHSSQTHVGLSAIARGAEIVAFLDRLERELAERGPFDAAFEPPHTTINVGRIDGGTAVNIVAGRCRLTWECRPVPGHDAADVRGRLERFVEEDLLPRMRERFGGADVVIEPDHAAPPLKAQPGSPAEALVADLLGPIPASGVAFATEAGRFQETGMSCVVIGPGSIEQAHKPDEFVALEQLEACQAFLRKVVARAADGD